MYYFQICGVDRLSAFSTGSCDGSLAADGCSLILLDRGGRRAVRLGENLEPTAIYPLSRSYGCLCYDAREGCYWAGCGQNRAAVYRLDETFRELERFDCGGCQSCQGLIRALDHDGERDTLLLTYANMVVEISKDPGVSRRIVHRQPAAGYRCCARAGAHIFCVWVEHRVEQLAITVAMGQPIFVNLPAGYRVLSLVPRQERDETWVYLLAVKGGCAYLLRGMLARWSPGCGNDCGCQIPPCVAKPAPLPGPECAKPCLLDCGHDHCEPPCGDHEHGHSGCGDDEHCHPDQDDGGCGDNENHHHDQDDGDCGEQEHQHGHHPDGCDAGFSLPDNIRDGCADIIQSIALEQTAISHILNAEGEKIQKVLAVTERPEDLLAVNESVRRMVGKLTHLELALCSKLELARETLCGCPGHPECCGRDQAQQQHTPVPPAPLEPPGEPETDDASNQQTSETERSWQRSLLS